MIYIANMVLIDMPREEPITIITSLSKTLLIIIGIGIVCFFYIKYLIGNSAYKKFKEVIWGVLFGLNALSSIVTLYVSDKFGFSKDERIVLIVAIIISVILTIQVIQKFRRIE